MEDESLNSTVWHWTPSSEHPTTQLEPSFSHTADTAIAIILLLCFIIGTFLNLVASLYFGIMNYHDLSNQHTHTHRIAKKLLYNGLYFLNAINDVLICFTVVPVALEFLNYRTRVWFSNSTFCMIWGGLWEVLPYTSIMYVAALSLTRTYHLVFPLKRISIGLVLGLLGFYVATCVGRALVPVFSPYGTFKYNQDSAYCFEWARQKYPNYVKFAEYTDILQLILPMIPILSSCLISTCIIYRNSKLSARRMSSTTYQMQQQASNTIILITMLYIVFNIPVIALCILYTKSFVNHVKYQVVFNSRFLYWYSWSCIYILGIALNSTLNPFLYVWRMKRFREFIATLFRQRTKYSKPIRIKQSVVSESSTMSMFLTQALSSALKDDLSKKESDNILEHQDLQDVSELMESSSNQSQNATS